MLKRLLQNTQVRLNEGKRIASNFWEVGLATLLQSIYEIDAVNKKEEFYEKIEDMKDVGVKNITLYGNAMQNICGSIDITSAYEHYGTKTLQISKEYTDAKFKISTPGGYDYRFDIGNLIGAKYSLYTYVARKNKRAYIYCADLTIAGFEGYTLPARSEILSFNLPNLKTEDGRIIPWQTTKELVEENYKPFVRKRMM